MVHSLSWFRFNSTAVPEYRFWSHACLLLLKSIFAFIKISRRYIYTLWRKILKICILGDLSEFKENYLELSLKVTGGG